MTRRQALGSRLRVWAWTYIYSVWSWLAPKSLARHAARQLAELEEAGVGEEREGPADVPHRP